MVVWDALHQPLRDGSGPGRLGSEGSATLHCMQVGWLDDDIIALPILQETSCNGNIGGTYVS